ncbi:hypothetical protein Taro_015706 [Colocasia esculenta]|uniref:Uncharacterized protein n=1 Tax=Colocasia esculenta TaxID=4460 RepID=A0A843UN48_COLES|nr:hypothetical protein [Colocasia esculenta]
MQAMQTQAHTQAALQAQMEAQESIATLGDLVTAQSSNAPPTRSPTEPVRNSEPSEAKQQDAGPLGIIYEEPTGPYEPQVVDEVATAVQDHDEAVKAVPPGPSEDVVRPTAPVVSEGVILIVEEPVVAPEAPDPSSLVTLAPPSPPSSSTAPPAPIPFKRPTARSISSPTPFPSQSTSSPAISTSIPPPPPALNTLQPHHQLEPHLPLALLQLDHPSYLLLPINPFFILLLLPPLLPLYLKVPFSRNSRMS